MKGGQRIHLSYNPNLLPYYLGRMIFMALAITGAVMSGIGAVELLGVPPLVGPAISAFSLGVVLYGSHKITVAEPRHEESP